MQGRALGKGPRFRVFFSQQIPDSLSEVVDNRGNKNGDKEQHQQEVRDQVASVPQIGEEFFQVAHGVYSTKL